MKLFDEIKERWINMKPGSTTYADLGYLIGRVDSLERILKNKDEEIINKLDSLLIINRKSRKNM